MTRDPQARQLIRLFRQMQKKFDQGQQAEKEYNQAMSGPIGVFLRLIFPENQLRSYWREQIDSRLPDPWAQREDSNPDNNHDIERTIKELEIKSTWPIF